MGRISIDRLKAGMVLDEDAISGGNTLLAAGAQLSAKHIDILRSWGILDIEIQDVSNADISAGEMKNLDSKQVALIKEQLQPLFKLNDMDDPFIAELYRVSLLYNIEKNKK